MESKKIKLLFIGDSVIHTGFSLAHTSANLPIP